jgi:type I restriction enzyme S subunit
MTDEELKGFEVFPNDIIVSCAGTIGETFVMPNNIEKGIINQALMRIKLYDNRILNFYLMYFDFILKNEANEHGKGTAIKNIPPFEILKEFLIPLPPIEEQKRIIDIIKEIDCFIQNIERCKNNLTSLIKQTKSKVLDLAIRGKLIPQNPNDEPAAVLLERIRNEQKGKKVTADILHYPDDIEIPDNWEIITMQNICFLSDGEKFEGKQLPYLDVKYLRGKGKANMVIHGKFVPKNSTLILVDGENSGEIFQVAEDGYQGSTLKILNTSSYVEKNFVFRILNKEQSTFRESKVGSAIPHLDKKLFRELLVFLPPLAEQKRIVQKIETIFQALDSIQNNL